MGRNGQMERSISIGPAQPRKVVHHRFFRNVSGWTEPIHSSFRPKFPEILVKWIAPTVSYKVTKLFSVTDVFSPKNAQAWGRVTWQGNVLNSADFMASYKFIPFLICLVVSSSSLPFATSSGLNGFWYQYYFEVVSWKIETEKKSGVTVATEQAKLGLVINTISLFTRTFATWYFCFPRKSIRHVHDPLVFSKT